MQDRDHPDNLVLLCPTHHRLIDTAPSNWPPERVRQLKAEHETWVSRTLAQAHSAPDSVAKERAVPPIVVPSPIASQVYAFCVLTPLDAQHPLTLGTALVKDALNKTKLPLPRELSANPVVNGYHTKLTEGAVINTDVREVDKGRGHLLELKRDGTIRFIVTLQASVDQITGYSRRTRPGLLKPDETMLRYTHIFEVLRCQLEEVCRLWSELVDSDRAILDAGLMNVARTRLFSREDAFRDDVVGDVVDGNVVCTTEVLSKAPHLEDLVSRVVTYLINAYGMVTDALLDDQGQIVRPKIF